MLLFGEIGFLFVFGKIVFSFFFGGEGEDFFFSGGDGWVGEGWSLMFTLNLSIHLK